MRDELAEEAQQLVERQQLDRQAQLEAVMEASFLRTQREKRVQHLKARQPILLCSQPSGSKIASSLTLAPNSNFWARVFKIDLALV